MKVFRIVLVLCVLNTFIFAQEEKGATGSSAATDAKVAESNASTERMSQDVKNYFTAEKEASLYYIGAGVSCYCSTEVGVYVSFDGILILDMSV